MRVLHPLWPRSLFGRLIVATVLGVLLAQLASLYLVARNEERVVLQVTTRRWAHRISEIAILLRRLPAPQRAAFIDRLAATGATGPLAGPPWMRWAARRRSRRGGIPVLRTVPKGLAAPVPPPRGPRPPHSWWPWRRFARRWRIPRGLLIRLPFAANADTLVVRRVRAELGGRYRVSLPAPGTPAPRVIRIPAPLMGPLARPAGYYDVRVTDPGLPVLVFRLARLTPWMVLPPRLLLNLVLLVTVLVAALYVATRGITRPLSALARAAEAIGRGERTPELSEEGPHELRHAAHAFNSMQERLHRYLDSRTGVLAAMSHDLKTPLTRLRLQVETLIEDPALRARLGRELDEMEGMVRGALALFRGLDEEDAPEPIDVNALVESIRQGFIELGYEVRVTGRASAAYPGRPQALKRCLTNLVSNAVTFGAHAWIDLHDGAALRILVHDDGPGIAAEALERVFEPFLRLEASRNRNTGGSGLGLSIARDVAQAHGGTVLLHNRPEGGLTAELRLPRTRGSP